MFYCPDYTGEPLKQAGGITQQGNGVDLKDYSVTCDVETVFPNQRVTIKTGGSDVGATYSLRVDDQEVMSLEGTGEPIAFTFGVEASQYEVVATSGSQALTMGTVTFDFYSAVGATAFSPKEIVFPREGGTQTVRYMPLQGWADMYSIFDLCNDGECTT